MDPLSVSASIVGLLAAAGKITSIVLGLGDADELTSEIGVEVRDFELVLCRLQNFVRHPSTRDLPHASMVDLEQVVTILTSSVMTFSEIEREFDRFKASPKLTTLRWAVSSSNIRALLRQLQNQKSSLLMILSILTCNLHSDAMNVVRQLQKTTEQLHATNLQMLRRLERMSPLELFPTDATSISGSIRSVRSMLSLASFEGTLAQSRLYNRLFHKNQQASLDGNILRGWSVLSGISLSEISNMAIYNLNITPQIVYNPEHYVTKPINLCRNLRYLAHRQEGDVEMHNFIKVTITGLVVDGSLGEDTTSDGPVNMVSLDYLYTMMERAYSSYRLSGYVMGSLLATNFGDEVMGSFLKVSLYIACMESWVDIVELLLDKRVDIKWEDSQGWTPLMIAVLAGGVSWHESVQADIVRLLLDYQGADIDASDKMGRTALLIATELGNVGCVRVLVERGASIDASDKRGRTALLIATEFGCTECVKILVERGASIKAKDSTGRSVLHVLLSIEFYDIDLGGICRILVSHGASIEARDNQGRTPLMIAAMNYRLSYMSTLGSKIGRLFFQNASINLADQDGNTALHLLLIHNPPEGEDDWQHELLERLLSHAKTDLKNREGKTAVQLCIERGIELPVSTPGFPLPGVGESAQTDIRT